MTRKKKKNQAIENILEGDQILDLVHKDSKLALLNMFKELKQTMPKELKV